MPLGGHFYTAANTCIAVCPIECIVPHPEHRETQEQLMEKFKGLNLFKA